MLALTTPNMKKILLFLVLIAISSFLNAQNTHGYFIGVGLTQQRTKEVRFTSNFRNGLGINMSLGYEKTSPKALQKMSLIFLKANQGKENISFTTNLRPELYYEYLKIIGEKGVSIGGHVGLGTILGIKRGVWSPENYISYSIWNSVGISGQYQSPLSISNKIGTWKTQVSMPIVTYLIRPSYTFPYTDNYLENDVFRFSRKGLAQKIITGGNIVLPNKFTNINFQTGIWLPNARKTATFGLQYAFNLYATKEVKPIIQTNHSLNLIIKKGK